MHGRSGIHTSKDDNDLLIIAAGYDHSRIVEWQPKRKDARKKVLLFGFPAISIIAKFICTDCKIQMCIFS